MNDPANTHCDEQLMQEVLAHADVDAETAIAAIDRLLGEYPLDPRLHFLKGSLLVGQKRFVGAHLAMARAIEIDPDYHLARFQLGFFELTSGEANAAFGTWKPLEILPSDHWLRLFTDGMRRLAEDQYTECIAKLQAGIAANTENPPLNTDMKLLIAECERLEGAISAPPDEQAPGEAISATSFLLGSAGNRRRH